MPETLRPSYSKQDAMGILQELQAQVELERAKRMKLEAQVEEARRQKQEQELKRSLLRRRSSSREETTRRTDKEYAALQTQVEGYRQLVEALTTDRPAIAAAMARHKQQHSDNHDILPLPLVRLLEWIPWHAHVQDRVIVHDTVYEWQHFDPLGNHWRGDLESFPDFFRALPVTLSPHGDDPVVPSHEYESDSSDDEPELAGHEPTTNVQEPRNYSLADRRRTALTINAAGRAASLLAGMLPSRNKIAAGKARGQKQQLVLTNARLTKRFILTAQDGYPLPNPTVSGTWRWIGRWTIDRPMKPPREDKEEEARPLPHYYHKSILNYFDTDNNKESAAMVETKPKQDCLCDEEGWTYAKEASHFVLWNAQELCWGDATTICRCSEAEETMNTTEICCLQCQHRRKPVLRRRKWTRQRVLVDYPMASEASLEYLRLLAHNASMKLAAEELVERFAEISEANHRVQTHWEMTEKAQQAKLEHYQSTWERQEERIKKLRYGKFKRKIEELACNQDDILPIIANPDLFTQLQKALRQSGAITNAMLVQGIHFYILDHVRPVHGKSPRKKASCSGSVTGNSVRPTKSGWALATQL